MSDTESTRVSSTNAEPHPAVVPAFTISANSSGEKEVMQVPETGNGEATTTLQTNNKSSNSVNNEVGRTSDIDDDDDDIPAIHKEVGVKTYIIKKRPVQPVKPRPVTSSSSSSSPPMSHANLISNITAFTGQGNQQNNIECTMLPTGQIVSITTTTIVSESYIPEDDSNMTTPIIPECELQVNDENILVIKEEDAEEKHCVEDDAGGANDDNDEENQNENDEYEEDEEPDITIKVGSINNRASDIYCREIRSLHKMVDNSKILTEYMNQTQSIKSPKGPRRSSRAVSCDRNSVGSYHEKFNNSMAGSSKKGNNSLKRQNMRSQNIEFSMKQQQFLNRVQSNSRDSEPTDASEDEHVFPTQQVHSNSSARAIHPPPKLNWDKFCWRCHTDGPMNPCTKCLRSYHPKCLKSSQAASKTSDWVCPECVSNDILQKTKIDNVKLEHLCTLLRFSLKRMMQMKDCQTLMERPNLTVYPDYDEYITQHMDLTTLQNNIQSKKYRSTESFAADTKWIQHNYTIYPKYNRHMPMVKTLMKVCRQELNEIETCAECYFNANTRKDWFVAVCDKPHILLWAKLKGFPFWPAKLMNANSNGLADVRFFGDHDRAWVPVRDCFLFSEKDPNTNHNKKRNNIMESIKEAKIHIQNLIIEFGSFKYAPFRTVYDPANELDQLNSMIPYTQMVLQSDAVDKAEKEKKASASVATNSKNTDNESKLKLKIIKTADNNLSVVTNSNQAKKSANKEILNRTMSESVMTNKIAKRNVVKMRKGELNLAPEKIKILEKFGVDGSPPTYQILRKNADNEQIDTSKTGNATVSNASASLASTSKILPHGKVDTVIIKRKSDNWKTVPQMVKKVRKSLDTKEPEVDRLTNVASSKNLCNEKTKSTNKNNVSPKRKASTEVDQQPLESIKIKISKPNANVQGTSVPASTTTNSIPVSAPVQSQSKKPPILITTTKLLNDRAESKNIEQNNLTSDTPKFAKAINTAKEKLVAAIDMLPQISIIKQVDKGQEKTLSGGNAERQKETSLISKDSTSERFDNQRVLRSRSKSMRQESTALAGAASDAAETATSTKSVAKAANHNNELNANNASESTSKELNSAASSTRNSTNNNVHQMINAEDIKVEQASEDEYSDSVSDIDKSNDLSPAKNQSVSANDHSDSSHTDRITVKDISKLTNKTSNFHRTNSQVPESENVAKSGTGNYNYKQMAMPRSRKPYASAQSSSSNAGSQQNNQYANNSMKNSANMVCIPVNYQFKSNVPALAKFSSKNHGDLSSSTTCTAARTSLTISACKTNASTSAVPSAALAENDQMVSTPAAQKASNLVTKSASASAASTPPSSASPLPVAASTPSSNTSQNDTGVHMMSGLISRKLASAITETIASPSPPALTSRPNGPLKSNGDVTHSSEAGPLAQILANNSYKMADYFRTVIEDMLQDLSNAGSLDARVRMLEMELEKLKHNHARELAQLKHNSDMILSEMRNSMDQEKLRILNETRKQCELERIRCVEDAKKKLWCTNCGKEAEFYCCWNTAYCNMPCQKQHWEQHKQHCTHPQGKNSVNVVEQITKTYNGRTTNSLGGKSGNTTITPMQR